MIMIKNGNFSHWVGNDFDGRTRSTHDGWVRIIKKNRKYSRWVGDDDDEEHEVLTMVW
jgi:hypothetical protein